MIDLDELEQWLNQPRPISRGEIAKAASNLITELRKCRDLCRRQQGAIVELDTTLTRLGQRCAKECGWSTLGLSTDILARHKVEL